MIRLRHQLPVHSPIDLQSLLSAAFRDRNGSASALNELASLLGQQFDAPRVVLTGSGTQALNLAIRAAIGAAGSPLVGLPGFCCYDVASAAIGADAQIALYDLEPATLTPDPASVERLLESTGAKVLVVAHLYGFPCDWGRLREIASRYGAILIEDAAQGHASSWEGRPLGSLGGLSVLSFGRGKGWTGSGGGALLLRDGWEATALPDLPHAGAASRILIGGLAHWALGRPAIYGLPTSLPWLALGETRYHEPTSPVGMHPTSAGVALRSAAASHREAQARRAAAERYSSGLRESQSVGLIEKLPAAEPGYLRFPVRLPRGLASFDSPHEALRLGVGRSYPTTLDALQVVHDRLACPPEIPGASALAGQLVTLPVHSLLTEEERQHVTRLLKKLLPAA